MVSEFIRFSRNRAWKRMENALKSSKCEFHFAMSDFFATIRHEWNFLKSLTRGSGCILLDNRLDT